MRKSLVVVFALLVLLTESTKAQYVADIIDYQPAPGQLINTDLFGSPTAAQSIAGQPDGLVSLGAFGGFIVVRMDQTIANDPNNPFGVDFTIFGNPLPNWSEPGTVEVMKDENGNGIPDEEWFLLAGSDYYWNSTHKNYALTWFNSATPQNPDVLWVDQNQDSGYIVANSTHSQNYYPDHLIFPQIDPVQQQYSGQLIEGALDFSSDGIIRSYARGFGYADNQLRGNSNYSMPDNPYTPEIENSGGDAMDISWARNSAGERVILDGIDFIRIKTAMNQNAGYLGEISTEIAGIADVQPNASLNGITNCFLLRDLPKTMLVSSELPLEALYFEHGIPSVNQEIEYSISPSGQAQISENNHLRALSPGTFTLTVWPVANPNLAKATDIYVAEPVSLQIDAAFSELIKDESKPLSSSVFDQNQLVINNMPILWESSDPSIVSIVRGNNGFSAKGNQLGECYLKASVEGFEQICDSFLVTVNLTHQRIKAFITVKTPEQTLVPRQSLWVENFSLIPYIYSPQQDYSPEAIQQISLAHAIAQLFNNQGLTGNFFFKDDQPDQGLYVWKLPVQGQNSLEFLYGYGGNLQNPYTKCWIVQINGAPYTGGFENILLNQNDEVLIYQIPTLAQPWEITHLTLSADSVEPDEVISAKHQKYSFQWIDNEMVLNNIEDLAGSPLQLNGNPLFFNNENVETNIWGEAIFSISSEGKQVISSDMDAVQVFVKSATSVHEKYSDKFHIYPNPVNQGFIHLQSEQNDVLKKVEILSINGLLIWARESSEKNIPIDFLSPGTYILRISTDSGLSHQRFIKI